MSLVSQAAEFSAKAHEGQMRKYGNEKYIRHPARVAQMVAHIGLSEEAVAAAWLHDVIEDCGVTADEICGIFGLHVAEVVVALTDPRPVKGGPNRATRKHWTRQRYALLQGQVAIDAHTIKVADCLDNAASIRDNDPGFWRVFSQEVTKLVGVLTLGHPSLKDQLCDVLGTERMDHSRVTIW